MKQINITYRPIEQLRPRANNARTHSDGQIIQIAKSIEHFGFTNPILIDKKGKIIAGHGRVQAARRLGLHSLPTVSLSDMTESQIRAYVIADNRLAEKAGWDRELLGIELQYLASLEIDFDVTLTSFEFPGIDVLLDNFQASNGCNTAGETLKLNSDSVIIQLTTPLMR